MYDVFKNISESDKQLLIKDLDGTSFSFEPNTSLKSFFKLSYNIGILIHGQIKIVRNNYNDTKNTLNIIHEGSIFGPKLFPLNYEENDIITTELSTILFLDYRIINSIHHRNNEIHQQFKSNILDTTTEIIIENNQRINILSQRTTRDKLIEYFEYCYQKTLSKHIYLPFNYKDLAEYLAVDRSAMTREIQHLKQEKIIDTKGKKITLLNK